MMWQFQEITLDSHLQLNHHLMNLLKERFK